MRIAAPCWREVSLRVHFFLLLLSPPHRTVHLRLVLSELGKPVSYETQSGARAYLLIDSLLGRRRPWFYLLTPRGRGGRERNTCAEVEGHLPLPSVPAAAYWRAFPLACPPCRWRVDRRNHYSVCLSVCALGAGNQERSETKDQERNLLSPWFSHCPMCTLPTPRPCAARSPCLRSRCLRRHQTCSRSRPCPGSPRRWAGSARREATGCARRRSARRRRPRHRRR